MKISDKNKYVVVTGCSSGIGKCAAEVLAGEGYSVIATVRTLADGDNLKKHHRIDVIQLDLASEASIADAVTQIVSISKGRLYALFNNAAYGQPGAVEDLSRAALKKQFEVNVFGTHELTAKLLPILLEQPSARIVQNSSVLGLIGMPMRGAYVASKFALEGLTDTLRMELSDSSVKVSLIEPGPIKSKFRLNALHALKSNVDFQASRHVWRYKAALERLNKEGAVSSHTLPPEAVVEKLLHALNSSAPAIRYYVTKPTYIMGFLRRIMPGEVIDWILLKYAQKE